MINHIIEERKAQLEMQILAGAYLQQTRKSKGYILQEVADKIGISKNFLSEIETGKKSPNDDVIVGLARVYEINEDELFNKYGKISLAARKQLLESKTLQHTISEIHNNKSLTPEDKERLSSKIFAMYRDFIKNKG